MSKKIEPYFLKNTILKFTDTQKEMLGDILGMEMDEEELGQIKTAFFNFEQLNSEYVTSLWAYGLMNCDIESDIESKKVIPFAALNADGKRLDYGSDEFANTNNWGVLCFNLNKGSADDCPVVWVYEGDTYKWADKSSSLQIEMAQS